MQVYCGCSNRCISYILFTGAGFQSYQWWYSEVKPSEVLVYPAFDVRIRSIHCTSNGNATWPPPQPHSGNLPCLYKCWCTSSIILCITPVVWWAMRGHQARTSTKQRMYQVLQTWSLPVRSHWVQQALHISFWWQPCDISCAIIGNALQRGEGIELALKPVLPLL